MYHCLWQPFLLMKLIMVAINECRIYHFVLFLFSLHLLLQVMRPMLYGTDVEVINVLHPCMIQLLPIMVVPTPRDTCIVLHLKVTHVHHMVLGLPECIVISLICHIYAVAYACIYMYVNVCFTLYAVCTKGYALAAFVCVCVCD